MGKSHTLSMTVSNPDQPMSGGKNNPIDMDDGRASMKLSTLMTMALLLISGAVGAVTWAVNTATKGDLDKHSASPHHVDGVAVSAPASIVPVVEANTRELKALTDSSKELHVKVDAQTKQATYINARLEFLVERELTEASGDPQARSVVRRAARKVRARRGPNSIAIGSDDPLAGL